jgi:thioredoxin reductase
LLTAIIMGSGPNGISATIVLAAAGIASTVLKVIFKSEVRVPPQNHAAEVPSGPRILCLPDGHSEHLLSLASY